jgi:hypothetical protein
MLGQDMFGDFHLDRLREDRAGTRYLTPTPRWPSSRSTRTASTASPPAVDRLFRDELECLKDGRRRNSTTCCCAVRVWGWSPTAPRRCAGTTRAQGRTGDDRGKGGRHDRRQRRFIGGLLSQLQCRVIDARAFDDFRACGRAGAMPAPAVCSAVPGTARSPRYRSTLKRWPYWGAEGGMNTWCRFA